MAAATALAAASGYTQAFAQAAALAVSQESASAQSLAEAMSQGSGGTIAPETLTSGDANAAAAAVDKGVAGGWVCGWQGLGLEETGEGEKGTGPRAGPLASLHCSQLMIT